ncbi:ParB/RepB/Spo0J family partition protein, partial [candidate division WWE3 bacterium]|nr:ParB/RepB/Spo0J family partition protein [candidate division WWE3 bacterium]
NQTSLINRENSLCEKHGGAAVPDGKTERSRAIKKAQLKVVTEKKVEEQKRSSALDEVLQQIMETASPPTKVRVDEICRFEEQPRIDFDQASLLELGESLKRVQIIPVFLRKLKPVEIKTRGGKVKFQLVDGERRWLSCAAVGKEEIVAIFLDIPDTATQFAISAIANFGRKDHTPIEEAYAIRFMQEEFGLSVEEAAHKFAKSVTWGKGRLKLLLLSLRTQKLLSPGIMGGRKSLKLGAAMLLADHLVDHPELQYEAAKYFVEHPQLTGPAVERHVERVMVKHGLGVIVKKTIPPEGRVHTARMLHTLSDYGWKKVEQLLQVKPEVWESLPIKGESRNTLRENLNRLGDKLKQLARKL